MIKNLKKYSILLVLLCVMMTLVIFNVSSVFAVAETTDTEDVITDNSSSSSIGTRYIYINDEADFIAAFCQTTSVKLSSINCYVLMSDIYLDYASQWNVSELSGIFDGNGHTIVGLNIKSYSLFGTIAEGAIFKDTNFIDTTITASSSTFGIVATTNNGTISGVNITYSADISSVTGAYTGMTIYNYGTIENSYVYADLSSSDSVSSWGGLVGVNAYNVTITEDVEVDTGVDSDGDGETDKEMVETDVNYKKDGIITNTYYHILTDEGLKEVDYYIIGTNSTGDSLTGQYTIDTPYIEQDEEVYQITTLIEAMYYLQIAGDKTAVLASNINIFNSQLTTEIYEILSVSSEYYTVYNAENNHAELTTIFENNGGSDIVASDVLSGSGTQKDPYIVASIADLALMASDSTYTSSGVYVKQVADISLVGYNVPSIDMYGIYYGGGFSISGLSSALFSNIRDDAEVSDLYIIGLVTTGSGLAYENEGSIYNITAKLSLELGTAGLVVNNSGSIERCDILASGEGYAVAVELFGGTSFSEIRNQSSLTMVGLVNTEEEFSSVVGKLLYTEGASWSSDDSFNPYSSITYFNGEYSVTEESLSYIITNNTQWQSYAGSSEDVYTLVFYSDRADYKAKISTVLPNNVSYTYSASSTTTATVELLLALFSGSERYDNENYTITCKWYTDLTYSASTEIELGTAIKDAGIYYALIEIAATDTNAIFQARSTYTITKAVLEYSISDFAYIAGITSSNSSNTIAYNGEEFDLTTIKPVDFPEEVAISYVVTEYYGTGLWTMGSSPLDAGKYILSYTISSGQGTSNYEITLPEKLNFEITKLSLKVSVNMSESITYNSTISLSEDNCYLPDDSGILYGESIDDLDFTNVKFISSYEAGTSNVSTSAYYIKVDVSSIATANYSITAIASYFYVIKADISSDSFKWVTTESEYSGSYNKAVVDIDSSVYSITYTDINGSVVPTYGYIDAGKYYITATINYVVGAGNYNDCVIYAEQTITATKLVITADDITVQYKDDVPEYTASYTLVERADGDVDDIGTLIFDCDYTKNNDRTTCAIKVSGASNSNYTIEYVSGNLYVDKADRELSLETNSMVFDGTSFEPAVYCSKENATLASGTYTIKYYDSDGIELDEAPSAVGSYKVEVSTLTHQYYNEVTVTLSFSISIGTLGDNTLTINGATPSTTYTYNGVGYVVGLANDLPSGVEFNITYSYTYGGVTYEFSEAPTLSDVGSYEDITITIKSGSYYPKTITRSVVNIAVYYLEAEIEQTSFVYNGQEIVLDINIITALLGSDTTGIISTITKSNEVVSSIKGVGTYVIALEVDNGNYKLSTDYREFTVTVSIAELEVDLSNVAFSFTYGGVYSKFNENITYTLGGVEYTKEVEYIVDGAVSASRLNAGIYSITSISSIYDSGVESVKFVVINGTDKVTVSPKVIEFDWSNGEITLLDTYVYNAEVIDVAFEVSESYFEGQKVFVNDMLNFSLYCATEEVVNVGEYVVSASITNTNYVLSEDSQQKIVKVTKAALTVTVNSIEAVYNAAIEKYTYMTQGLYLQDSISPIFQTEYSVGDSVGTYDLTATVTHSNYDITVIGGEINVSPADITGVSVEGGTVTYSGASQTVTVSGVGDTYNVEIDSTPINVGEYTVTVLITADNYNDLEITVDLIITQAELEVEIADYSVLYRDDVELSIADIVGQASFNGEVIAGAFSLAETALTMGYKEYEVVFTPESGNYAIATATWKVTSYIEDNDINLDIGDGSYQVDENGTVEVQEEYVKITIDSIAGLENANCELYVDGYLIQSGTYTIRESTENVLIEIKLDGTTLYSQYINFIVASSSDTDADDEAGGDTGSDSDTDLEEDSDTSLDEEESGGSVEESSLNTGLIIGIVCGVVGLIAIGIVVAIIIKKKQ